MNSLNNPRPPFHLYTFPFGLLLCVYRASYSDFSLFVLLQLISILHHVLYISVVNFLIVYTRKSVKHNLTMNIIVTIIALTSGHV